MSPYEKFEACIKLAEFGAARHDGRREYEWKVTLGLWAAILAAITTFKGHRLPLWVGPLTILFYSFVWLRGIWVSNEMDKRLSLHYRRQAQEILADPSHVITTPGDTIGRYEKLFGFLSNWSMFFQLAVTVALLLLAYLFIK